MGGIFPVLYHEIFISVLRLWASVLESGSRQDVSQSGTDNSSRLKYLREVIWFWWNQAALQQKGFTRCLVPSLLTSWAPEQPNKKCLDFRCFSLCSRITTTRNVRLQNAHLLCSCVAWSLQNSLCSLAPRCIGNCHAMGFQGSCLIVRPHLLTNWWTVRRLGIPKPAIPNLILPTQSRLPCSYILFIRPNGNIWCPESLTALTSRSLASNFLPAYAPPALRMLWSGAACPINCSWGYRLIPKMTISSSYHWEFKVYRWIINWLAVHIFLDTKITT